MLCHTCKYNRLPEEEPSGSKHIEDIVKIENLNITLTKAHFDCLYYSHNLPIFHSCSYVSITTLGIKTAVFHRRARLGPFGDNNSRDLSSCYLPKQQPQCGLFPNALRTTKILPSATLSVTNPIWTSLVSNRNFRS
jgi:hypothetical protein